MSQPLSDQCGRFTFQLDPLANLAWRLNLAAADFRFRRWLNTRAVPFPGEPERTCDTVAHLDQPDGEPWAVVIEFQTEPDSEEGNSKNQEPNSKEIPRNKFQMLSPKSNLTWNLALEVYLELLGIWFLVLGISFRVAVDSADAGGRAIGYD